MRPTNEHHIRDMKTATRALLDRIGLTVFAELYSRVKVPELSKYGSLADPRTIPIDVLTDAEMIHGDPIVLRVLAGFHGFVLVPVEAVNATQAVTADDIVKITKEFCDVVTAFQIGNADGRIDAADRRVLHREIDELQAALNNLRRGL